MGALWLVFSYFVVLDWRFGGTVGKRFLGLTVTALDERRLDLRVSFERNFLSLPVPIIGGFLLNMWIRAERIRLVDYFLETLRTIYSLLLFRSRFCFSEAIKASLIVSHARPSGSNMKPRMRPRRSHRRHGWD